jgi:hypothetical protein
MLSHHANHLPFLVNVRLIPIAALLVQKQFAVLPAGDLVLRIENFATIDKAKSAATPASVVVEAAGKVWLLTLSAKGQRSHSGQFVTEVGPIPPIPYAANYVMDVAEADLGPANKEAVARAIHIHPGPEIFYLLTGEQCLETPNGVTKARAGEGSRSGEHPDAVEHYGAVQARCFLHRHS